MLRRNNRVQGHARARRFSRLCLNFCEPSEKRQSIVLSQILPIEACRLSRMEMT